VECQGHGAKVKVIRAQLNTHSWWFAFDQKAVLLVFIIEHRCVCYREAENQMNMAGDDNPMEPSSTHYNIEFTFDSDVKCAITIYYFAVEEIVNKHAVYNISMTSVCTSNRVLQIHL